MKIPRTSNELCRIIACAWPSDRTATNPDTALNERQRLVLNKLLDGFDGKLKSSKWAKMAKCSADTALRDIQGLIDQGILIREEGGGRSVNYALREY